MKSDFSAARRALEAAYFHVTGDDATSLRARETIDLLLEAIITAEHLPPQVQAKVLPFPSPKAACRAREEPDHGLSHSPDRR